MRSCRPTTRQVHGTRYIVISYNACRYLIPIFVKLARRQNFKFKFIRISHSYRLQSRSLMALATPNPQSRIDNRELASDCGCLCRRVATRTENVNHNVADEKSRRRTRTRTRRNKSTPRVDYYSTGSRRRVASSQCEEARVQWKLHAKPQAVWICQYRRFRIPFDKNERRNDERRQNAFI